jgi:hypothetical protein
VFRLAGYQLPVHHERPNPQFKGGQIPAVAVRDLVIQPRENDLVLATHGRGIASYPGQQSI